MNNMFDNVNVSAPEMMADAEILEIFQAQKKLAEMVDALKPYVRQRAKNGTPINGLAVTEDAKKFSIDNKKAEEVIAICAKEFGCTQKSIAQKVMTLSTPKLVTLISANFDGKNAGERKAAALDFLAPHGEWSTSEGAVKLVTK